MKYFAKYLPVDGEIKKNDIALKPSFEWRRLDNTPEIEPPYFEKVIEGEDTTNMKLAKLFLCSRDIQIGDKVIHEDNPSLGIKVIKTIEEGVVSFEQGGKTHDHNLIKIIGEISPEATWVREEDEFTDNDVKFVLIEGFMRGREMSLSTLKSIVGNSHTNVRAHIKGPCGHYH